MSEVDVARHVAGVAAGAGLGSHRAAYAPTVIAWNRIRTVGAIAGVALAATVLAFVIDQAGLAWITGLIAIGASFGFALDAAQAWWHERETAGNRLAIYDHGVVAVVGGRTGVARFDSTTVLQKIVRKRANGGPVITACTYTLTDPAGQHFVIDSSFVHADQWGQWIQQAVTEAQLPQALAAVQSGHRLGFGDIWLTASEIGARNKSVPWHQVQGLRTVSGYAEISVEDRWFGLNSTSIADIPNFFVLHALVERLRGYVSSR
ncbi:DUF6585 family protein [Nocardia sp. NPDC057663]|uniref:DUF6585 family protein n=1 Tax=Nocardia sp. NPDC057663 TaxID=3346201 RepID=UPI00366C7610